MRAACFCINIRVWSHTVTPEMSNRLPRPSADDARADDAEIGNYARLLDSLSIGLLVFSLDGSEYLRNARAEAILGKTPQHLGR